MQHIPHGVLSERFQEHMRGRRLVSAVFLTFGFEPDFFEQEVLPVVLDLAGSHAPAVRLLQLEDALKTSVEHVAVYYDRGALLPGSQSARLDVQRIPTSWRTGYFHPKNVLLLTEAVDADAIGRRPRALVVAAMSANLTRAGWWENVEVCHIETVGEGEACGFRDDLLGLLRRAKDASPVGGDHAALETVRRFVRDLSQRQHRTGGGVLHPRLYHGGQSVVDFLGEMLGERLSGLNLEVISPYFDKDAAQPLRALCERFSPREVRLFLPRADDGGALCDKAFGDAIRELEVVHWAQLPPELLRRGKAEQVKRRRVHAKVYRFFSRTTKYEALFVGSVNLTRAGFAKDGNFETGFLVETEPKRLPDWWMEVEPKRPSRFLGGEFDEPNAVTTSLSIRYDWSRATASAFWDVSTPPGVLSVSAQGAPLFDIPALPPREWRALPREAARHLEQLLASTSFLGVREDGGAEATILVQEEGMAQKPSLVLSMSLADILRYWALFTPEQRADFLDGRPDLIQGALRELGYDTAPLARTHTSIFDSFAGVYHAFHLQEQAILAALEAGRTKEAEYRLLGKKYDSLPSLLRRVIDRDDREDVVTRYVITLCAHQLAHRIEADYPDFASSKRKDFTRLKQDLERAAKVREDLTFETPEKREAFLDWFERQFLTRAQVTEAVA